MVKELRVLAMERDEYTCRDCGFTGKPGKNKGSIQVHHIVPRFSGGENKLSNLVTLCRDCHKQRHKTLGYREYWKTRLAPDDLRPEDLIAYREKHDLKQADLARLLGVHYSAISLWEPLNRYVMASLLFRRRKQYRRKLALAGGNFAPFMLPILHKLGKRCLLPADIVTSPTG